MSSSTASSAAAGPPPGMAVRLSSNESPYGPAPAAVAAARAAAEHAHLYPDDQSVALREVLAAHEGVGVDQITVGTGSAAILMDTVAALCAPGSEVVAYDRSFIVYRLAARNAGVGYVAVGTDGPAVGSQNGYGRDPQALIKQVSERTSAVLIDNPGNPTGAHLTDTQLREVVAGIPDDVTIVVDEAYHQFAVGQRGYQTTAEAGVEHPRLVVARTFSKAYALAGLRVGYLVGPADLVAAIDGYRPRFNVNAVAQAAAVAALDAQDHLARTVTGTLEGRERMVEQLRGMDVAVTDGLGNFVTIEVGGPAGPVVDAFAQHGVGVRPLAPYGMDEQIRVSVGTPDEVDAFLAAAKVVLT